MSTFRKPPLDYTVVREHWSRYDLADSSILKVKIVLTRVFREDRNYSVDFQNIFVVLTNERGQPDTRRYAPAELQQSITNDDMRFTTVSQDWNEYVDDNGTSIRIQPIVMRVAKTSKFDAKGFPVYIVEMQGTVRVRPPSPTT